MGWPVGVRGMIWVVWVWNCAKLSRFMGYWYLYRSYRGLGNGLGGGGFVGGERGHYFSLVWFCWYLVIRVFFLLGLVEWVY